MTISINSNRVTSAKSSDNILALANADRDLIIIYIDQANKAFTEIKRTKMHDLPITDMLLR